ncbi:MAG: amino acid adenylation domain-containing protein [Desulfatirhabdiaceae bacterium]
MSHSDAIAVIGMSCRFPGARNITQFWDNLKNGIESITQFSDQELTEAGVPPSQLHHPDYVKSGFILEGEDLFDASFFGYSPREAEIMDPQQRLFLETAWEAMEDGGYATEQYDGSIGVFAGSRMSSYLVNVMDSNALTLGDSADLQMLIANDKDFLTSRVSFKFNLRGPSITVQSACSTSLVAVHMACGSLFMGDCDMALVGGVSLNLPQKKGYLFQDGLVWSSDGHCRVFDAKASGMVPGNGVGVVLLKRLEDAVADHDAIYAIITGSAVNNDGSQKVGYTTPSVTGQLEVIREAQGISGVSPDSISYIETHGTGTVLGDPVETEALCRVFGEKTDKKGFCALGSVKSNIGHLDTAAGIAGFIKTVLCLKYGYLVPSLNYEQPNPKIDFRSSPFYVNTQLSPWQVNGYPKRAGVSSFGFGGTNAHVIMEEAPDRPVTSAPNSPLHLLTLSAKTKDALRQQIHNHCRFLENNPEALMEDVCFTANTGRYHFSYRFAAIGTSADDFHLQLCAATQGNSSPTLFQGHVGEGRTPKVAFDVPDNVFDHDLLAGIASDSHTLQPLYHLSKSWTDKKELLLFLSALGKLYVHGATIDWEGFYHNIKPHRISLPTYPFEHKRYWKAVSVHKNASTIDPFLSKRIWDHFNRGIADYIEQYDFSNISKDNTIERISVFYFARALQNIGVFSNDEHVFTAGEVVDKFGILPAYRPLLTRVFNFLTHHKMLRKTGNKYHHLEPVLTQMFCNSIAELDSDEANPEGLAELIQACGKNFGEVLRGIKNHKEIVFPEGSIERIEKLYVNSPQAVFFNSVINKIISEISSLMSSENVLRILEISAGTGAITQAVLPGLSPQSRYIFTDRSSSFLNKAKKKFQAYPFMAYEILDIEKSPGAQGFENASFDLIIASNILHTTKDMAQTLSHIQTLLAPGGVLLIRDITRYIPQFDFVFGPLLTKFDDGTKRDTEPFLPIESWKKTLAEHQFSQIMVFPGDLNDRRDIGEHILAARTDVQTKAETGHTIPAFTCRNHIAQPGHQSDEDTVHPFLGKLFYLPSGITYQKKITLSSLPAFLREHRIFGEIAMPGGYVFEMALTAGKESLQQKTVLKNVLMHEALVLEPDDCPVTVQTILSQEKPGKFSCKIFSTPESEPMDPKHWKLHFSGTLERQSDSLSGSGKKMIQIQQRCIKYIEIGDHLPVVYGVVHDVKLGGNEAIGQITFPEMIIPETMGYDMPPAFLDPCLHIWSVILRDTLGHDDGDTFYLPVAADKVCYFSKAPESLLCHVELLDLTDKNNLTGNITLYDMAGETIAEIAGLHLRPVTPKMIWASRYKKISYEVSWQTYPDQKTPEPDTAVPGCWLLLADQTGVAEKLSREIRASNDEAIVVFAEKNQNHSKGWTVSEFENLFKNEIISKSIPCKGIVFMWALDTPDTDELASDSIEQITRLNYLTILHLLRANVSSGLDVPKLYIVTRNSQLVSPGDHVACVTNSIFWGLGKVIVHEHPEIQNVCIDFDSQKMADEGKLLWHHLRLIDGEHEIAFRDNQKLVSRLVRTSPTDRNYPVQDLSIFNSDATYIITGGFGGMGIESAKWLAKNKVSNIVLLGRHSPSASAIESIQEIRAAGINVRCRQVNVGDEKSLSRILHDIRTSMPSIKGVFHLAGVLGEADILRQDVKDMEAVMVPKVEGAWNLHRLTLNDPIDHFVMFSSITSLFGGHGLGAYSASNMFLDILASYRKTHGLPALSINWGAFSEKGMIAKDNAGAKLRAKAGIDAFTPQEALAHLFTAMGLKNHHICLAKIRWSDFFSHGLMGNNKLFNQLAAEVTIPETVSVNKGSDFLSRFTISSLEDQHNLLENHLKQKVSETLRVDKKDLAAHTDLIQMGMDSLIFLELSQSLGKELEVQITPHTLFKEPTIKGLTHNILEIIGKERDSEVKAKGDVTEYFALQADPANRFEPFELTDIQQAYWVGRHGVMGMGQIACHTYYEVDIDNLDMDRYTHAWNALISRHEMLRVIVLPDGRQQIMEKVPKFEIDVTDFTSLNSEFVQSKLLSIRERMSHQIFQTDEWPLFEIKVSLLNETISRVHMSLDLLFADAHSIRLIFYELNRFYNEPEWAPDKLDISFRDYVISEKKFRESVLYTTAKTYWCNRLETLPGAPGLPVVKQLQDIDNPHFKRRTQALAAKKWSGLKRHASSVGLTPAGLLLSVYAKILSRWSNTNQFSINLTVFNRLAVHPRINEIIGDFTSVMFLEVDDSQHLSFEKFAANLQNQLWQDMEHRFFSGVQFLRELAQVRGRSSMEIMPVVFTSNITADTFSDTGNGFSLADKPVYGISQTPQVWMDLQVSEINDELVIFFDAVEDLFPQGMLDDMFAAYGKLLDILSNDEKSWTRARFRLLPDHQVQKRAQVNATKSNISETFLHGGFEIQARNHPDHVAMITSDCSVTYGQLSRLSNKLGYLLQRNGAEKNSLVAVVMEKGWEQVAAVLGVLKSGAAYLPVDPGVPKERLQHILKDGEVGLVLTQPWLERDLAWPDNVNRFTVDMHDDSQMDAVPDQIKTSPEDLAYVIYTSGSTGIPKGVMINHKGAVNTILDINNRYQLTRKDRVFALSNLNFDLSVYDIFGALGAGAAIVMPDNAVRKDPGHWLSLIKEAHVTVWNSVPALMEMLVEYVSGRDEFHFDTLRLVLLSGDWIPLGLPDKIRKRFDPADIISLGGATEASIWSILFPVNTVDPNWNSIPYGRPMANQDFHVLNKKMEPCPEWVPGQLYIGGTGLAKGYWRDVEKTKASFIQHPQTGIPLYRTGDIGRFRADGNIEFMGREDRQVKINGYRIELGEIEAAMLHYPGIKEAVANVTAGTDNKQRIVGYVVSDGEIGIPGNGLEQFLGTQLPAYMIPGTVVELKSLPLTPNGKIDRKNLPMPDMEEKTVELEYYPPENELELKLSRAVQKILRIDKISTRELFMSIGANSLDMVKIQNALAKELKIEVSVVDIFEHSTIHRLALFISQKSEEPTGSLQVHDKVFARKTAASKRYRKKAGVL